MDDAELLDDPSEDEDEDEDAENRPDSHCLRRTAGGIRALQYRTVRFAVTALPDHPAIVAA
jgi:hypothetical protein